MGAPSPNSALPPRLLQREASPKAISERTSYLQVRLEFLRYPHLIPALFNVRGFGPPSSVTWTSPWTWVDHLVSGLRPHTIKRPIQTRFRFGCVGSTPLNLAMKRKSQAHYAKGTQSPETSLRLLQFVGT